jgi:hypothetical protein
MALGRFALTTGLLNEALMISRNYPLIPVNKPACFYAMSKIAWESA